MNKRIILALILLSTLIAACSGTDLTPAPTATTVSPTVPPLTTVPSPTSTSPPPTATLTASLLNEEESEQFLYQLLQNNNSEATEAIERILAANDQRFIAPLIELYWGRQSGLVRTLSVADYLQALETLSGQAFGFDWPAWVEWYGTTDHVPPPGFTSWKGQLLAPIDSHFGEFLQDRFPSRIRVEEIQWGGVQTDGIPPLNNPRTLTADQAAYLNPHDPVFGLHLNDEARAYPLRILDWHEMANDTVGGIPVSLAYCTLCGAAVAYDGRASDGTTYTFGTSGFLFRSNKLMYDRQTNTLWNQLTGEPVLGELADTDVTLTVLPVVLTTWAEWQAEHPDTLVLDVDTGFPRDYTPGAAYGDYFAADITMFPVAQRNDLLGTKDQIFALRLHNLSKAYPLDIITEERVVNDQLGETAAVIIASRGTIQVDGNNRRAGPVTYSAGGEVRAYERGQYSFNPTDNPDIILDETEREWQVTEDALIGPNGETLKRLGGHLAYWFGWFAFFPHTQVYGVQ